MLFAKSCTVYDSTVSSHTTSSMSHIIVYIVVLMIHIKYYILKILVVGCARQQHP